MFFTCQKHIFKFVQLVWTVKNLEIFVLWTTLYIVQFCCFRFVEFFNIFFLDIDIVILSGWKSYIFLTFGNKNCLKTDDYLTIERYDSCLTNSNVWFSSSINLWRTRYQYCCFLKMGLLLRLKRLIVEI